LDQVHARFERYLKRGFGQTGHILLGHHHLNTTQVYARIYDETLYEQFKTAMSSLEAIEVNDWPGIDASETALTELWASGYS